MTIMKNLKGFPKLFTQILILGLTMIVFSFLTETEVWNEYFCYKRTGMEIDHGENFQEHWMHRYQCSHDFCDEREKTHFHWNYRGWVYLFMCVTFFGISIAKIIKSHKAEDFN